MGAISTGDDFLFQRSAYIAAADVSDSSIFATAAQDILLSAELAVLGIPTVISALPTLIAAYQSKTMPYSGVFNGGQFVNTATDMYASFPLTTLGDKINTGIMATLYYEVANGTYTPIQVPAVLAENIYQASSYIAAQTTLDDRFFQDSASVIPIPLGNTSLALADAYIQIATLLESQVTAQQTWS